MKLTPITLAAAKQLVRKHHRHNMPPLSWKFGVGLAVGGRIVGCAMAGRPNARPLDVPTAVEITRVVVAELTKNGNSRLYGAITRAAAALGYETAYTYSLQSESGASLKAAGFVVDEVLEARATWDCRSRRRNQTTLFGEQLRPDEPKVRWKKVLR